MSAPGATRSGVFTPFVRLYQAFSRRGSDAATSQLRQGWIRYRAHVGAWAFVYSSAQVGASIQAQAKEDEVAARRKIFILNGLIERLDSNEGEGPSRGDINLALARLNLPQIQSAEGLEQMEAEREEAGRKEENSTGEKTWPPKVSSDAPSLPAVSDSPPSPRRQAHSSLSRPLAE
jgi:hypothetical protein